MGKLIVITWLAMLSFYSISTAHSEEVCSRYIVKKPWDYNDTTWRSREDLRLINEAHFNRNVSMMTGSARHNAPSGVMGDLHFTLARFPNHYPALDTVSKYQARKGFPFFPQDTRYLSAQCYLQSAIELHPDDPVLRLIQGINFYRKSQWEKALNSFQRALDIQPDYLEAYYNIAFAYLKLNNNAKALEYAKKAYAGEYPLPGLKRKLVSMGIWNDK